MNGFTVKLYMPSGDPEGLKVIEKSNWIGRGVAFPRSLFSEARRRQEIDQAGVYILIGESDDTALPRVYIGEGDPVRPRIDEHIRKKEFWNRAVFFTSKDNDLNKAHIQYFESRLYSLAASSRRCAIDNDNAPTLPSLTSQDHSDAELFLADILLCMPILGYGFFTPPLTRASQAKKYHLKARGIEARGYESSQGFVVRAGSTVARDEVDSIQPYLSAGRADLLARGVIVEDGGSYKLSGDYLFASPSSAAGILLGRSSNGRELWKTTDGRTLKSIQEAETSE